MPYKYAPKHAHLGKYAENLEDSAQAVYPSDTELMKHVLNTIASEELKEADTAREHTHEHKMNYHTFNACIRKLKQQGILLERWGVLKFSSIFQKRLTAMSQFYSEFTGKQTQYQKLLQKANELLKPQGITLNLQFEDEPDKIKELTK